MLEFIKENDAYATILLNDVKIGILERYRGYLIVEVCYTRKKFKDAHKRLISGYVKRIHFLLNKPPIRIKKSILHSNYKILE